MPDTSQTQTATVGKPKNRARTRIEESPWRAAWTKSTFLLFCVLSYLILAGIGGLIVYLIYPRLLEVHAWVRGGIFAGILTVYLIIGGGLFLIIVTALSGKDVLYPHGRKSVTVSVLFPIAVTLAQLLGVKRDTLRTSYVKVNNALTKAQRGRIKGDRILVLLPHCLQIDVCNRKITNDINNCLRCGRCPVSALLAMGEKYNLTLEVVNGGTLARRKVASFRPDGIVAVACERDLTLGIQSVYPIPVFGVINDRPYGPCYNTAVDMDLVEEAIGFFRKDREPAGAPA